jgi:hypothetical protein
MQRDGKESIFQVQDRDPLVFGTEWYLGQNGIWDRMAQVFGTEWPLEGIWGPWSCLPVKDPGPSYTVLCFITGRVRVLTGRLDKVLIETLANWP